MMDVTNDADGWSADLYTRQKREAELKKHEAMCDHLRERVWNGVKFGDHDEIFLVIRKVERDDSIESMTAIIEPSTADGVTPVYEACKGGFTECARLLIEAGAGAGRPTKSGKLTPLFIAAQKGNYDCIELLLKQRCARQHTRRAHVRPLRVRPADPAIGARSFRDVRVNHQTKDGRTALYAACEGGQPKCVQMLLDAGATIDVRRDDRSTPLIAAAYFGRDEVIELLLGAGAKLLPRDSEGTALENARRQKHTRCIELLEAAMKQRGSQEALDAKDDEVMDLS
jgi:hypothetical protein